MWRCLLCCTQRSSQADCRGLGLESTFRILWLPYKPALRLISTNSFQFSLVPGQEEASCYSMTNQSWTDASPNRAIWSLLWVPAINASCCSGCIRAGALQSTGNKENTYWAFSMSRQCPKAPAPTRFFLNTLEMRLGETVFCLV